jgi:hypothetical protein
MQIHRVDPIFETTPLADGKEIGPPVVKRAPMQVPVWTKPALWGAVVGAVGIAIVGFSQLGWRTSASAEQFAQDRADTAVVAALVPFCVTKAQHDPDQAILTKLHAEDSAYSRSDMVTKAGWATVGGGTSPDSALADACSQKLHDMKSS